MQGRLRQQGGLEVEESQGPGEEEEEDSELPGVFKAPQAKPGKWHASPQEKPTQAREASRQDASTDLKSKDSSDFKVLPDIIESSDDEEIYTDSLTSHTTATDSTIETLTSPLEPMSSRVEEPQLVSKTESQFSSSMPYLEASTPSITNIVPPQLLIQLRVMIVSLCQTLVLTYQVLHPLQLPPSQGEVLEAPEENLLKGMERFIPLIPWLIWDHIFNAHVNIVQAINWYLIIGI